MGLTLGYVTATIKGPTWVSEAVLTAKGSDFNTPGISSLGMLGGMVANQLNIANNPGLDKIELILDSKKFNAEVIYKYNLLPLIYKNSWPDVYKKVFDTTKASWNQNFVEPNLLKIGKFVKNNYLKKESNKNNTMFISFESHDSLFSDTLLSIYLTYLNHYLQTSVQEEAHKNVRFLEDQLIIISDPLLREKLQSMIASELEKTMLVSDEAFKIIDPKLTTKRFKEKLLYPLLFAFCFMFLSSFTSILLYTLYTKFKSSADEEWIEKIKKESGFYWLFRLKRK